MITLKELVQNQSFTGATDIEIIRSFFTINNLEEKGVELIYEISKDKIEKLKQERKMAEDWITILPSKYLYENYDLDIADRLHRLELDFLNNNGKLSNFHLKWAEENVPNIIRPQAYFNPLVEWLEERGIKFIPREPIFKRPGRRRHYEIINQTDSDK